MRRFYLAATVLFWLLVAAFWAGSRGLPPAEESVAVVTEKSFSAGELASHATPENCWMAIRGSVYDLSAYLPEHPSAGGDIALVRQGGHRGLQHENQRPRAQALCR